ncbi:MAG: hypothetical protein H8E14_02340 [Candidatus Marinimicrobia bacterium]|nr:hypothetical protein [Candidatus Neomarinimicrobiota bacterium]
MGIYGKSDQVIKPAVIMVVDVDDNVRELMKDVLEKDGHEVYCFDNGMKRLRVYRKFNRKSLSRISVSLIRTEVKSSGRFVAVIQMSTSF